MTSIDDAPIFYIYEIRHKVDQGGHKAGECLYAGVTKNPAGRWSRHKRDARQNKQGPRFAALRKYGVEKFDFVIVRGPLSLAEGDSWEQATIAANRELGEAPANISDGGGIGDSIAGGAAALQILRQLPTEERRRRARKGKETLGPDGCKEITRRAKETLGIEGRRIVARKGQATRGPEGRRAAARKARATLGPEGRRAARRKQHTNMGAARRSAAVSKANQTRGERGRKHAAQKRLATLGPDGLRRMQEKRSATMGDVGAFIRSVWEKASPEARAQRCANISYIKRTFKQLGFVNKEALRIFLTLEPEHTADYACLGLI